jgi:DNA polymerase III delta' subunit
MFDLIPGQQPVKELFARALRDGTLGHAYLLGGPEGLAKTAFARELAVALVASCGGCGRCEECERARRGVHPDLHVLEREGELIRIEQVAPIIEELALKPFAAARRVWVIPEVEYLTAEAANKLLKSIEEPPSHVYFLLVTDRFERVLPTIVSRCQVVEFRPVSDGEVLAYLRDEFDLAGAQGEALARLSAGSVERAARFAADARGPGRRAQYLRHLAVALSASDPKAIAEAQHAFLNVLGAHLAQLKDEVAARLTARTSELERQFQDVRDRDWHVKRAQALAKREEARLRRLAAMDAVDVVAAWTRDLWVVACGASDVLWDCDRDDELAAAAVATPEHYRRLLEAATATRKDLYLNIDFELALRAMFCRFEEVAESA